MNEWPLVAGSTLGTFRTVSSAGRDSSFASRRRTFKSKIDVTHCVKRAVVRKNSIQPFYIPIARLRGLSLAS
jgi:hypothetical protein